MATFLAEVSAVSREGRRAGKLHEPENYTSGDVAGRVSLMPASPILDSDLLPTGACAAELYLPSTNGPLSRAEDGADAGTDTGADTGAAHRFAALHDEEKRQIEQAVGRRQQEFADGRWCAHRAMVTLGVPPDSAQAPILRGPHGMPLFPKGITGSITHTVGDSWAYRAAVVAAVGTGEMPVSVGVDAEPSAPLPGGILERIASSGERRLVGGDPVAARLLFSVKESIFKVCYPLVGEFLDFDEAEVVSLGWVAAPGPVSETGPVGQWQAVLTPRGTPAQFTGMPIVGRWSIRQGIIVTTGWAHTGRAQSDRVR